MRIVFCKCFLSSSAATAADWANKFTLNGSRTLLSALASAGGGPSALAYALHLLEIHGSEIAEYSVDDSLLERLDSSALTESDMSTIEKMRPVQPSRWYDYVHKRAALFKNHETIWWEFPLVVPYAIIDPRIRYD